FLPKGANKYPSECFPRCEYHTRFNGTSAFQMTDPAHWRTYFRSTACCGDSDRLSKLKSKDYENPCTNAPNTTPVIAGTFHSPWQHTQYNAIFHAKPEAPKVNYDPAQLYNLLLSYKNTICLKVVQSFNEKELGNMQIVAYISNEYPCIMVKIREFSNIVKEPTGLYEIAIAYFVAMTNKIADSNNIPIELVNRSSFGHNTPSVSEIITAFRINIGIVPEIYAEVLVESLINLNDEFLVPLLNSSFHFMLNPIQIKHINDGVSKYNDLQKEKLASHSVSTWSENEDLIKVLMKVCHPGGRKIYDQIVKEKKYVDILTNYVSEELEQSRPNLASPLIKMLGHLSYFEKAAFDTTEDDYSNISLREFPAEENPRISEDLLFWRIMRDVAFALDAKGTHELSEAIRKRNLNGLYSSLEKANLEFIRNSGYQDAEDGCGSDSDCEVKCEPVLYSKKVIVATGMRAINLAHFLSIDCLRQLGFKHRTDAEKMYFETKEATNSVRDACSSLDLHNSQSQHRGDATIRYVDLSYCAASGPENINLRDVLKRTSKDDVVVFDYTSTNTENINMAVNLFITKVEVILLVNSGLKNEQLGADMNPYGTIRIVSKDRRLLTELYLALKNVLERRDEILPKQLHRIRKAYKNVGAVVTNEAIYKQLYWKIGDAGHDKKYNRQSYVLK
ncbi:unnamed protein product, partial [Ixodes persulcatus]